MRPEDLLKEAALARLEAQGPPPLPTNEEPLACPECGHECVPHNNDGWLCDFCGVVF